MLTTEQVPYTGPYYGPSDPKGPNKGNTAEALKRFCSRLGLLQWTDFDQHYNAVLESAMRTGQAKAGISPASGQYGQGSYEWIRSARVPKDAEHAGQYALDRYSRALIQAEAGVFSDSKDETRVQAALSEFGYGIIRYENRIGYDQTRPGDVTVRPGEWYDSDCSLTVIQAFDYAKRKTGLPVPDPSKMRYSGYGNTDLYQDDHPKVGSPFRIGDLGHFHSPRHVIMCIRAGDMRSAEWVSHGRPGAPELVRLPTYSRFPGEFLYVVRPPLIPEAV